MGARIRRQTQDATIERATARTGGKPAPATPKEITKFIERSVAGIPPGAEKDAAVQRMRAGLIVDKANDDTAAIARVWNDCEQNANNTSDEKFAAEQVLFLRDLVCNAQGNRKAIAAGIVDNWIRIIPGDFAAALARGLLGTDGRDCATTKDMNEPLKDHLRHAIAEAAKRQRPTSSSRPSTQ